jgi:xanthine/CO dehydrogenase XdhC/CoxF family maturation factor
LRGAWAAEIRARAKASFGVSQGANEAVWLAHATSWQRRMAPKIALDDPRLDDSVLLDALKSPALYVGALGPRVNQAKATSGSNCSA